MITYPPGGGNNNNDPNQSQNLTNCSGYGKFLSDNRHVAMIQILLYSGSLFITSSAHSDSDPDPNQSQNLTNNSS